MLSLKCDAGNDILNHDWPLIPYHQLNHGQQHRSYATVSHTSFLTLSREVKPLQSRCAGWCWLSPKYL